MNATHTNVLKNSEARNEPAARKVELTLDIEVLEERIAPAYFGGPRPAEPVGRPAAPCCA